MERLDAILKTTRELIKKRERKRLDFERVQRMKDSVIEKSLNESVQVYEALNVQLKEEIPQLCNQVSRYMEHLYLLWKRNLAKVNANIGKALQSSFSKSFTQNRPNQADQLVNLFSTLAVLNTKRNQELRRTQSTKAPTVDTSLKRHVSLQDRKPSSLPAASKNHILDGPLEDDLSGWNVIMTPSSANVICKARFTFNATRADELSILKGEAYQVLDRNLKEKGWWLGKCLKTNRSGLFPSNYVDLCEEK